MKVNKEKFCTSGENSSRRKSGQMKWRVGPRAIESVWFESQHVYFQLVLNVDILCKVTACAQTTMLCHRCL